VNDRIEDFIRLRSDIEMLGLDRLIEYAIARGDPATLCGLIEVLELTSPEAVDLTTAFAMLPYRGDGGAGVETWKRRASALFLRHIGEAPEVEPLLAN
jgi:hypothetical protein